LNKHTGADYFTMYLKKVLLAWILNVYVNCGTPYKQVEMNALRYVQAVNFDKLYIMAW